MSKADDKTPQPMDAGAPERAVAEAATNNQRVAYGLVTLMTEIHALFDSVIPEYKEPDGRNTLLAVALDLSEMDEDDRTDLTALISLFDLHSAPRIESITVDDEEQSAYIKMRSNPRIQDSRQPFGLAAALEVLSGADEDEGYVNEDDDETFLNEAAKNMFGGSR